VISQWEPTPTKRSKMLLQTGESNLYLKPKAQLAIVSCIHNHQKGSLEPQIRRRVLCFLLLPCQESLLFKPPTLNCPKTSQLGREEASRPCNGGGPAVHGKGSLGVCGELPPRTDGTLAVHVCFICTVEWSCAV